MIRKSRGKLATAIFCIIAISALILALYSHRPLILSYYHYIALRLNPDAKLDSFLCSEYGSSERMALEMYLRHADIDIDPWIRNRPLWIDFKFDDKNRILDYYVIPDGNMHFAEEMLRSEPIVEISLSLNRQLGFGDKLLHNNKRLFLVRAVNVSNAIPEFEVYFENSTLLVAFSTMVTVSRMRKSALVVPLDFRPSDLFVHCNFYK